jgi:hypothetical protein
MAIHLWMGYLNQKLIKQGWCWWYWQYVLRNLVLGGFEKYAREGRIGLRAERLPVLPWECRKRQ